MAINHYSLKYQNIMMIQLTATKRNNTVLSSVPQLFDTELMLDVQAEGSGAGFWHNGAKYQVSESLSAISTLATGTAVANIGMRVWGIFDTAVVGNRTIAAHSLLDKNGNVLKLPVGAIITEAFYVVDTTFTSATDAATMSVGCLVDAVAGLKAAIAISNGANAWDAASPVHAAAMIPVETAATMITPLTAERDVTVTVAVEALTAGKMRVCISYTVAP